MYRVYIQKKGITIGIKPYEFGLHHWIALIELDKSKYIYPEDTNDQSVIDKFHVLESLSKDSLAEEAWEAFYDDITLKGFKTFERFKDVFNVASAAWLKNNCVKEDESGATCKECNNFFEYAIASDNFICTSCKSYKNMY